MSLASKVEKLSACAANLCSHPRQSIRALSYLWSNKRGAEVAQRWRLSDDGRFLEHGNGPEPPNALRAYFDAVKDGRGVSKWTHYFELYHHHLQKFIGRNVTVVEVGVHSGGSLRMWRHYFGERCVVHGVDIEETCRAYEDANTTIHIGDQEDRSFWERFRRAVPAVDVFIDDGGHQPEQQMVTLEEMLPHLRPGGVYICEDIAGPGNPFSSFAYSLADELNQFARTSDSELASTPTPFQTTIHSIHLYPFVLVIEKRTTLFTRFSAPKRGTDWQPFL